MKRKKSIIIIEDEKPLADSYAFFFEKDGYETVITDTKTGALDYLNDRTFSAAIVDLQLRDQPSHKGGIDVVEYIRKIDEGTKVFTISATTEVKEAVQTLEAGIVKFIPKGTVKAKEIVNLVNEALEDSSAPLYGDHQSLVHYLSAPDLVTIIQSQLKNTLDCDFDALNNILWKEFKQFLPVLRLKDGSPAITFFTNESAISTLLWSKGVGYPIWFSACNKKSKLISPSSDLESTLTVEGKYQDVITGMWRVAGVKREEFVDYLRDTPWG